MAWLADTYTNPDFAPMLPPASLVRTNQENREAFRRQEVAYIQSGTDFYARLREEQPELAERTTYHRPVGGRAIEEFNGLSSTFCLIARESPNLDPARQLVLFLFQSALLPREIRAHAATTCRSNSLAGARWLAVGDAATAFDPLSSMGISKAFRSGLGAAMALLRNLQGDHDAFAEYARTCVAEYEHYLVQRRAIYCQETRWQAQRFWSCRQQLLSP